MELLKFQSKAYGRVHLQPDRVPRRTIKVIFQGGAFRIFNPDDITFLNIQGKYGHELGDRQNNTNPGVFPEKNDHPWAEKQVSFRSLELSLEEIFYLKMKKNWIQIFDHDEQLCNEDLFEILKELGGSSFVSRLAVYVKLRDMGWCVRSGLTYGCQYLIYKELPNNYHASAGVYIGNDLLCNHFVALTRALTNVKKAAILATVHKPTNFEFTSAGLIQEISVKFLTSVTFFPDRIDNMENLENI